VIGDAMDAYEGDRSARVVSGLQDVRRVDSWARDYASRLMAGVQ
jgi:hypothetical protein